MTSSLTLLVLAAPIALLAAALFAATRSGGRSRVVDRGATWASWLGVAVASAAGVFTAGSGPRQSETFGWEGLGLSVRLDAVSTIMLLMVALLAVAIVRYSITYLDGDPRHRVFIARLAVTIASVEMLVLAGNLGLLFFAWITTSLSLHRLLVFYPERRGAVIAARKKFIAARIGDALLVLAVALLYGHFGTGDLTAIFDGVTGSSTGTFELGAVSVAAVSLAFAAILKSAQFPTHGWLVEVMETPTPVSALLHAGILNAGPFLIIRMSPVMDGAGWANGLLITAGGFTALFASVVLLTQPTVKVALGYSSAAHMGFMLMVCGIGIYPAAFLHLVAHSFYKAHAFLASGSVIDEARAGKPRLPVRLNHPARLIASTGTAVGLYLVFAVVWGIDLLREPELAALGFILVLGLAQLVAPAIDSTGPMVGTTRVVLLAAGVTTAFFLLEAGTHHLVHAVVPEITGRSPVHLALAAAVLVAFTVVVGLQIVEPARRPSRLRRRWAIHLRNGLYANALFDRTVGSLRRPIQHAEMQP